MAEDQNNALVITERGQKILGDIKDAYKWKDKYQSTCQELLDEIDHLFFKSQQHMTKLSSLGTKEAQKEVDAIVEELINLRNHLGPALFPPNMTALARESIELTLGGKEYRIDTAQYFEPIPYYSGDNSGENFGELMKLYRFSVYNLSDNSIILRYFLERSNVLQLYHVLCFTTAEIHGQLKPYGTECPDYWDQREQVLLDMKRRYDNE